MANISEGNPYATPSAVSPSDNQYASPSPYAATVDPSEVDIISQTNNPNVESPSSFGFVSVPVDIVRGTSASILSIPRDVGATVLATGENIPNMQDMSAYDAFMASASMRVLEREKANAQAETGSLGDKIINQLGNVGQVPRTLIGAAKDAFLSRFSDKISPTLVDYGNKMMEQNDAALTALHIKQQKQDGVAYDIGSGVGSVLKSFGAAYIAKSPAGAGGMMAWTVASNDYLESRKAGKSPEDSLRNAMLSAAGQGKIESVGLGVFENLAKGSGFLKRVFLRSTEQTVEETAQGVVEETVKGVAGVRDTPMSEKLFNIAYQGALGFVMGAPVSAVYDVVENSAKAAGFDADKAAEITQNIIKNKDAIVRGIATVMQKEASGITNNPIDQKKVMDVITEAKSAQEADAKDTPKTDAMQVDSANKANAAIAPIMEQQAKAQQQMVSNIQSETDDISINLLREVSALEESKQPVDAETKSMFENIRALLQEHKNTPKPKGLTEFIRSIGGVAESSQELKTMGMNNRSGARNDKTGISFDAAREAAAEAGYIDSDTTVADFLVALESDFKGFGAIISQKDIGSKYRLDEIDSMLSALDKELNNKGITYSRKALEDLRRRVAMNKSLDEKIAREYKAREKETQRLESDKRMAEKAPPVILADKLKTFLYGMRKGGVLQKQETKTVQNALIDIIATSGLDAADRAKFIKSIRDVQTIEQLDRAIPAIQERVDTLVQSANRKSVVSDIKKILSRVSDSGTIAVDVAKKISSMVDSVDVKNRTDKTISELEATLDYLRNNPTAEMPKAVINKLSLLNKRRLEDVPTSELEALRDTMLELESQGKTKLALIEAKKERLKQARLREIQAGSVPIDSGESASIPIGEKMNRMQRIKDRYISAKNKTKRASIATNPMDVFFDMLDGTKNYAGANYKIFKKTIDGAFSKYLKLTDSSSASVKALHDKLTLSPESYEKIAAWATLQQEGGEKKLLSSGVSQSEIDVMRGGADKTPEQRVEGTSVVGKDGKPLRVLHGGTGNIKKLQPGMDGNEGIYFTSQEFDASAYADKAQRATGSSATYPVYLNMENPYVIEDLSFWQKLRDRNKPRKETEKRKKSIESALFTKEKVAELKAQGFDGVINKSNNEFIVFDPEQVVYLFEGEKSSWLSNNENKMYQEMRKALDAMLPSVKETMRLVYNKDVTGVKDYFPFITDHDAMVGIEIQDTIGDKVPFVARKKNVEQGFTKARTGGNQAIRLDALGVFLKHVDNAAYLIEMGEHIKSLSELANTKEYKTAVGDIGHEAVAGWLNLLARKGNAEGRLRGLDALRRNVGFAVLGFKLSTVLVQPTSLMDGSALIGGEYTARGVANFTKREWREFLVNNMPEIKHRVGDDAAYLDLEGNGVVGHMREAGFYALKKLDLFSASSVAIGAYIKNMESRGLTVDLSNPDSEAIAYAQLMMRRTQASAFAKDTPAIISQGKFTGNVSVDKLIFQFQSFMFNRWSLIRHDLIRAGVVGGMTKQAANIAVWMILAQAAEVGVRRLSKELMGALTGDAPDDWEDTITKEVALTALGTVPFVSQTVSAFGYGDVPVPSLGVIRKVLAEGSLAVQSDDPEKRQKHVLKAINQGMGVAFGIPAAPADALIEAASDE